MIGELTNHLWQSTLFAVAAGLLTVAFRKNRAQVRYWLWFSASLKFLIPFSLLMSLGSHLEMDTGGEDDRIAGRLVRDGPDHAAVSRHCVVCAFAARRSPIGSPWQSSACGRADSRRSR